MRCVKKCKEGYLRNDEFKCIKRGGFQKILEKEKHKQKTKKLICSSDKVINPYTKRCVAKCKSNEIRDENFRCKTKKVRPVSAPLFKFCPFGKEMNPYTKNCVKKCGSGYKRGKNFECVKK